MKKLLLLMLLIALAYGTWTQRHRIASRFTGETAASRQLLPPSPELAERADEKLLALKQGRVKAVAFHANELQSLVQFRYQQLLPAFVAAPQIALENDHILVRARVPVDRLPALNELGQAAAFLPDTADAALTATVLPLQNGRAALAIDQVSVARIPLPQRLVPRALRQMGRRNEPGLPEDALALPLPPGAAAAYIRGDSLVLLARPVPRSTN